MTLVGRRRALSLLLLETAAPPALGARGAWAVAATTTSGVEGPLSL
ncbi:hypothetical protein [Nitrospirillum bahiense]|uniref:Secreted protein n=1 Tax=Nitrospirillum amazonense TaxID=28077 RepID=A0A560FV49_9PROT|nr:hypothetical protein [Nitrospirillum amazonense]TWB25370.1 hypothetical protein FBZ88_110127 [Nitrospirillum amazonense]